MRYFVAALVELLEGGVVTGPEVLAKVAEMNGKKKPL